MTFDQLIEYVPKLAPAVTAGCAVFGATIAYKGLAKWKQETVGKRKLELAEDLVCEFSEIRDLLAFVRFPGWSSSEGEALERRDGETDSEYRVRAGYYVPVQRISKNAARFADLEGKRYRAAAYFGKAALHPFEELTAIKSQIISAARMLSEEKREDNEREHWNRMRGIIGWVPSDQDPLRKRIDEMVEEAERIFGAPLRTADK